MRLGMVLTSLMTGVTLAACGGNGTIDVQIKEAGCTGSAIEFSGDHVYANLMGSGEGRFIECGGYNPGDVDEIWLHIYGTDPGSYPLGPQNPGTSWLNYEPEDKEENALSAMSGGTVEVSALVIEGDEVKTLELTFGGEVTHMVSGETKCLEGGELIVNK